MVFFTDVRVETALDSNSSLLLKGITRNRLITRRVCIGQSIDVPCGTIISVLAKTQSETLKNTSI